MAKEREEEVAIKKQQIMDEDFQKKVANSFRRVFEEEKTDNLQVITVGDKTLMEVQEEVRHLIADYLQ